MATEAQRKARDKYNAQRTRITIDFYPTESDLYDHIGKQDNKAGYIKDLIRKDMNMDSDSQKAEIAKLKRERFEFFRRGQTKAIKDFVNVMKEKGYAVVIDEAVIEAVVNKMDE